MAIEFVKNYNLFEHEFKEGDVIEMNSIPSERNLVGNGIAKYFVASNCYSQTIPLVSSIADIPMYEKHLKQGCFKRKEVKEMTAFSITRL